MPLVSGTKLGPYEVLGPLGAGGMGEVYLASDTRLKRDVALKVLPEPFINDAQRLVRFEREAQVLASLNHSNIARIHGLQEEKGIRALVMELVEGPTLAERLAHGPIAFGEALPIAKQVAEALEYAHEKGIIHRDLKPANIKMTQDGQVKVLDFGLAKALEGESGEVNISTSPTISAAATRAGVLLGTAAYMSPEQAKGKTVDRRTDIWAFGCVLYEMLVGRNTFGGETTSDILACVIRDEPDWSAVPASVPPRIGELLRRCLQKEPKQRLQAIGDARIVIEEALSRSPTAGAAYESLMPRFAQPMARRLGMLWALAGISILGLVALIVAHVIRGSRIPARPVARLMVTLPPADRLALGNVPALLSRLMARVSRMLHTMAAAGFSTRVRSTVSRRHPSQAPRVPRPILLSRWAVAGIFRRREAEEGFSGWWSSLHPRQRAL